MQAKTIYVYSGINSLFGNMYFVQIKFKEQQGMQIWRSFPCRAFLSSFRKIYVNLLSREIRIFTRDKKYDQRRYRLIALSFTMRSHDRLSTVGSARRHAQS